MARQTAAGRGRRGRRADCLGGRSLSRAAADEAGRCQPLAAAVVVAALLPLRLRIDGGDGGGGPEGAVPASAGSRCSVQRGDHCSLHRHAADLSLLPCITAVRADHRPDRAVQGQAGRRRGHQLARSMAAQQQSQSAHGLAAGCRRRCCGCCCSPLRLPLLQLQRLPLSLQLPSPLLLCPSHLPRLVPAPASAWSG